MWHFARSVVLFVVILPLTSNVAGKLNRKTRKDIWINVYTVVVAGDASVEFVQKCLKTKEVVPLVDLRLPKYALAANLVLLSNDVEIQPDPTPIKLLVSSNDSSFSAIFSSPSSCPSPCSSTDGNDYVDSTHLYFDIALPSSGLKFGLWTVNDI